MTTELPPTPPIVSGVLRGYDPDRWRLEPHVCERLRQHRSARSGGAGAPLTVSECSALLAAIDADVTSRLMTVPPDFTWRTASVLVQRVARRSAALEHHADGLREVRRQLVDDALRQIAALTSPPEVAIGRLVEEIIWPIFCRAWLPQLWYEPIRPDGFFPKSPWRDPSLQGSPGAMKQRMAEHLAVDTFIVQLESLAAYLTASSVQDSLHQRDPVRRQQWENCGHYLQAAVHMLRTATSGSPEQRGVRILFTPHSDAWPHGHLLCVMVLPYDAEVAGDLVGSSLSPAREAVATLLSRGQQTGRNLTDAQHAAVMARLMACAQSLAVGDYPGGGKPPSPVEGPSAGLPLTALLLGLSAGVELPATTFATAEVHREQVVRLSNAEQRIERLHQKGQAMALLADRDPDAVRLVLAHPDDIGPLASSAAELGIDLPVRGVSEVPTAMMAMLCVGESVAWAWPSPSCPVLADHLTAANAPDSGQPTIGLCARHDFDALCEAPGFEQLVRQRAGRQTNDEGSGAVWYALFRSAVESGDVRVVAHRHGVFEDTWRYILSFFPQGMAPTSI